MERREFIRRSAGTGLAVLAATRIGIHLGQAAPPTHPLPRRPLGRTGERLSVIGFGGIVAMGGTQRDADQRVGEALDRGINYFDVAPTYGNGEAEEKLGNSLRSHRDRVFLACKTQKRDKDGAAAELEASLKRLHTDHFDLYQLHAIRDVDKDVKRALGPGGAMETFLDARKRGQIRFLGFSAHSAEAALAAIASGLFDTILYPINFCCHYEGDFDDDVLAAARARGMGILALKAMAKAQWPKGTKRWQRSNPKCWYEPVTEPGDAGRALRWTLSQPGVVAAIPPGDETLFRLAMDTPGIGAPVSAQEIQSLQALAQGTTPVFARA